MGWFYIEAGVVLVIALGIIWWTTRELRSNDKDDDRRG
jgi:hypothetical protein